MKKNKRLLSLLLIGIGLIAINSLSQYFYGRFDLTQDKRYTLSEVSKQMVKAIDAPLIIDIFLEGDFPSEFRVLQNEVQQLMAEFQLENSAIKVNYINPIADENTREQIVNELTRSGLEPYVNTNNTGGKVTQELIFPWAYASYKNKRVKIPLLQRSITKGIQDQIGSAIQNLEYAFTDGFNKLVNEKSKTVAILKGNGQLDDIYIADFLKTIKAYYNIAPFTLDSVAKSPERTLNKLKAYDLIVVAKPSIAFSESEKLVLDQYMMHGGKSLWLTEAVIMDKDSLYNASGSSVSTMRDLNLKDFFFKYGLRINPSLVKDMYSAPIMLAMGAGSQAQLQPIQWPYSPLSASNPNHPITKNINLVKYDFASPIDTLKNSVDKTVLLQSSTQSKLQGTPSVITLADVTQKLDETTFNAGPQNLAVLLEGRLTSVYDKRILPFQLKDFKSKSAETKLVVISDGDVIKNNVVRNKPQELGFDQLSGNAFGNKAFLLNTINYLLDDTGLVNIRAKNVNIAYLDVDKTNAQKTKWQLLNIGLPLALLGAFGIAFNTYRKKKYS